VARIEVKADVTGSVWKVFVKVGEWVDEGYQVMILESMKMEIPVIANDAGRVTELRVAEGDTVSEDQVVAILEG